MTSKTADRLYPVGEGDEHVEGCPACEARKELLAAKAASAALPLHKRTLATHPTKKAKKEAKKTLKIVAEGIHGDWVGRARAESLVERQGREPRQHLDGTYEHDKALHARADAGE